MQTNQPTSPKIETRLRVEACPACALVFSFPLDFYLARLNDQTPIHCPAGHAYTPARKSRDPLLSIELVEMQAEIRQLHADLEKSRAYIARLPQAPEGPVNDQEFQRRVELLTNRAERVEYGKTLCRICGKQKREGRYMRSHLKTMHRDEILQMPMAAFD